MRGGNGVEVSRTHQYLISYLCCRCADAAAAGLRLVRTIVQMNSVCQINQRLSVSVTSMLIFDLILVEDCPVLGLTFISRKLPLSSINKTFEIIPISLF